MKLTLTFEQFARHEAFEASLARGIVKEEDRATWGGPTFEKVSSYRFRTDIGFLEVTLGDTTVYFYPLPHIARIKAF